MREGVGEFAVSLRAGAGGEVIARIDWRIFLVNGDDRFTDVVGGNDVNAIRGLERKNRQTGENAERLHHVKLRGFRATAIAEHDSGTENGARDIGEQLVDHVFAEFFGARVGIVVGALPIDGGVFLYDFVLACSCDSYGRHVRKTAQAMVVLGSASKL